MIETDSNPVVILGAGINGCALARELVLNGVPVWVVDSADIAFGATSKSSRLIHGGLRYLEYGEFRLVRESLDERDRLRRLAPQFVEPLRLFIPVSGRFSGVATSALRFLGGSRVGFLNRMANSLRSERGLWLARAGLKMYDSLAANADFPPHTVHDCRETGVPRVDAQRFSWLLAYSDGQMRYPERFVLALLEDARRISESTGVDFRVLTYRDATCTDDGRLHLVSRIGYELDGPARTFGASSAIAPSPPPLSPAEPEKVAPSLRERRADAQEDVDPAGAVRVAPRLIVNASGAWGDFKLRQLRVPSGPLFGGTKGSHFLTFNERLVRALGGHALYAEAADGRLVFVLPFGESVYVGTTDLRFTGRPENAVASDEEVHYLIALVNELIPDVGLTRDDVTFHCCGVRPLPYVPEGSTASISRDHAIVEDELHGVPILTLVGGKLTTCRAFAEQVADRVFARLGRHRTADTRERVVPGGESYPPDAASLRAAIERLAEEHRLHVWQAAWAWSLYGTRAADVLRRCAEPQTTDACGEAAGQSSSARSARGGDVPTPATHSETANVECLDDTPIPIAVVDWMIEREWAATLPDLIERRLMLVYERELSATTLRHLAARLVAHGRLPTGEVEAAIAHAVERLRVHYGRSVAPE